MWRHVGQILLVLQCAQEPMYVDSQRQTRSTSWDMIEIRCWAGFWWSSQVQYMKKRSETGYSMGPLTGVLCLALFTLSVPGSCREKTPFSFLSLFHPSSRLPYPHLTPYLIPCLPPLLSPCNLLLLFSLALHYFTTDLQSISLRGENSQLCFFLCRVSHTWILSLSSLSRWSTKRSKFRKRQGGEVKKKKLHFKWGDAGYSNTSSHSPPRYCLPACSQWQHAAYQL